MNNLLERLHASFFFYLLVGTTTFMKIGSYLPSAVLVSTAMLFGGLGEWVKARWIAKVDDEPSADKLKADHANELPPSTKWVSRRRPVLPVLSIMIGTHVAGAALFYLLTRSWFIVHGEVRPCPLPIYVFVLTTCCTGAASSHIRSFRHVTPHRLIRAAKPIRHHCAPAPTPQGS